MMWQRLALSGTPLPTKMPTALLEYHFKRLNVSSVFFDTTNYQNFKKALTVTLNRSKLVVIMNKEDVRCYDKRHDQTKN